MKLVFDASSIFEAIANGNIRILSDQYTLELARYELGNILWKRKILIKDIDRDEFLRLSKLIKKVLNLMNILNIDCNETEVLKLADKYRITFYDASYVYMAISMRAVLVTEDNKLKRKIGKDVEAISLLDVVERL